MSLAKIDTIIEALRTEGYQWHPARRVYILKRNGKKRPLGLPVWSDKLLAEVIRLILNAYYDVQFSDHSHGFREGRGCHTALQEIYHTWGSATWIIEGDISDCFGSLPHDLILAVLSEKIHDGRFLHLMKKLLDAGYLEEWKFNRTLSGVPQGSIVSPILSNSLLNKLDTFVETVLIPHYTQGKRRKLNQEYVKLHHMRGRRGKGESLKGKEEERHELERMQQERRRIDQVRKQLPSGDPFDDGDKRLYFCGDADDCCMGIMGSRADAQQIRQEVRELIEHDLRLSIAEEKSHLRQSKKGVTFVGSELKTDSADRVIKLKGGTRHTWVKSLSEQIQLPIPQDKMQKVCTRRGSGNYATGRATHKPQWMNLTDAEILLASNGELAGLANYYALATGVKKTRHKLEWIWHTSLLKTLANKHKTGVNKMVKRLKSQAGLGLAVKREQETRYISVFGLKDLRKPAPHDSQLEVQLNG